MAYRSGRASPEPRDDAPDSSEDLEEDADVEEDLDDEDDDDEEEEDEDEDEDENENEFDENRTLGEEFLEDEGDWDDEESTDTRGRFGKRFELTDGYHSLVLEGGGMRGVYTSGVLEAFDEAGASSRGSGDARPLR